MKNSKIPIGLQIVIILTFFIVMALISRRTSNKFFQEDVHLSFKGVVIKKYFLKCNHIVIKTEKDSIIDDCLSHNLNKFAEIGDSIIKIGDKNKCFLIKPDTTFFLDYVYKHY